MYRSEKIYRKLHTPTSGIYIRCIFCVKKNKDKWKKTHQHSCAALGGKKITVKNEGKMILTSNGVLCLRILLIRTFPRANNR